jgi:hypothetical protein
MTEGKVLVIAFVCYAIALLAMVSFFPGQLMP